MAISVIGSTVLGLALLRSTAIPRVSAALLALSFPSMLVVPGLLGHNSLAMLPVFLARGAAGRWLRQPSS